MYAHTIDSQSFQQDQLPAHTITVWDTPYPVLENGIASGGIIMEVINPLASGWTARAWLKAAAANADISAGFRAQGAPVTMPDAAGHATTLFRTDNLTRYWAGGAPGFDGATVNGEIAFHFRGTLRSPDGRAWFDAASVPTWFIAAAGQGAVRIDLTVGATVTTILPFTSLSETDYLLNGFVTSAAIASGAAQVDIYYVQDDAVDPWGGFTFKAVSGAPSATRAQNQARAAGAPILACDLIDDGAPPTPHVLPYVGRVNVRQRAKQTAEATFTLPIATVQTFDGVGWEYRQTANVTDPGVLYCWKGDVLPAFAVKRQRLVQIDLGFDALGVQPKERINGFTGLIEDFDGMASGTASVTCLGFETLLTSHHDKNYPDKVSYMSAGYRSLSGSGSPVFEIPAFDNWTLESACRELCMRSGVVPSQLARLLTIPKVDGTATTIAFQAGDTFGTFRARTMAGKALKLSRAAHYGNAGRAYTESKPADDPYVFKPENVDDLLKRAQTMTERFGYDFRFDERGSVVLQPRNNPHWVFDLDTPDVVSGAVVLKTAPTAHAGTYLEATGAATITTTVKGARIDLSLPRAVGLGAWTVSVTRVRDGLVVLQPIVLNPAAATGEPDTFFYDYRAVADGTNATISTLFSGELDTYRVTLTAASAGKRRVDSIFAYHTDPARPLLAAILATDANALEVQTRSTMADMRNAVTAIGRRKEAAVDSDRPQNANNPESEFVVDRAVNLGGIINPADPTFVGRANEATIYDDTITDQDFAAYISRTFIYRYRVPKPSAPITHTLLPVVQLRDPVYAAETLYQTLTPQTTLWVTAIEHTIDANGRATTTLETSAYPEYPAYEPRDDIDIDKYFDGKPVVNITVGYTSCTGHAVTNLADSAAQISGPSAIQTFEAPLVGSGAAAYIDCSGKAWPPVPGTVQIRPGSAPNTTPGTWKSDTFRLSAGDMVNFDTAAPNLTALTDAKIKVWKTDRNGVAQVVQTVQMWTPNVAINYEATGFYGFTIASTANGGHKVYLRRDPSSSAMYKDYTYFTFELAFNQVATEQEWFGWVADTPYHHFTNVDSRDTQRKIFLPWVQGDGSSQFQRPSVSTWAVRYRAFSDPYAGGVSPFFDVRTTDLGYTVNLAFDALVSAFYRVSLKHAVTGQTVAYLTEIAATPDDPESHWTWMAAGGAKTFSWDGVDQLGVHNAQQSTEYAELTKGVFEQDQSAPVGKGYLVWNTETTAGGGQWGNLAVISGERDATGTPVYGVGTFSQFFVHIEVRSDDLQALADANPGKASMQLPRSVRTLDKPNPTAAYTLYTGGAKQAVIYTHMPRRASLELAIADWKATATAYEIATDVEKADPNNWVAYSAGWSAAVLNNPDAVLSNQRPIRVRFKVAQPGGVLWANKGDQQQGKLARLAHLKATVHDQWVNFTGSTWPNTGVDQAAIVSRRAHNDTHTIRYADDQYRLASSLKWLDTDVGSEWVFYPSLFAKQWTVAENEPLEFGNYLQLEELPNPDGSSSIAGARSRYLLGLMSYLFYLSAHWTDRTGRTSWGVNRQFVDQSKLLTNSVGDWWDPASPQTAATAASYRTPLEPDSVRQHRRTVVTRQWTDEVLTQPNGSRLTWAAREKQRWGFGTGSIGEKLLKHYWYEHEPTSSTIGGTAWSTLGLSTDTKSDFERLHSRLSSGTGLGVNGEPSLAFPTHAVTRQLGATVSQLPTSSTALGLWTWESHPLWLPSITRDFHPFFHVPPMPDENYGADVVHENYVYGTVDGRQYNDKDNTGDDAAAFDVWSSRCGDMSWDFGARYTTGSGWKGRLDGVGTKFVPNDKGDNIPDSAVDVQRQDEVVHYAWLRGLWSRHARPAEAPVRVVPSAPYYINPVSYASMSAQLGRKQTEIPLFKAKIQGWFDATFRREYYVESAAFFPVDHLGAEMLAATNGPLAQLDDQVRSVVKYDAGAWTGWKDDLKGGAVRIADPGYPLFPTALKAKFLPAAVGTRLPGVTTDQLMHLVLVNERRDAPVTVSI